MSKAGRKLDSSQVVAVYTAKAGLAGESLLATTRSVPKALVGHSKASLVAERFS